jgi:acyl-CoA dehydrogenase
MSVSHDSAREMSRILLDQADRLFQQFATKAVLSEADQGIWPDALWNAAEQAGLTLALVPEERGGAGLDYGDVALLIRRSAYHTVPVPLAETILAKTLWAKAGGEPVAGAVTLAPTNARDALTVVRARGGGATLSGRAERVPWGAQAGHALVFAHDEDGSGHLCLVPRGGATATSLRNLAFEPRDTLLFEGVAIPEAAIRPAPDGLEEALMVQGAALRTQQMAGAMERCLDYALTYANERVQFGRPIGKFQAIQHMLAIAAGQVAASIAAADSLSDADEDPGFSFLVAIAKARVGEAAGQVAAICHQVHAAMGFTQEHPLHFATRRLWSWRDEFGAEAFWQARIGRLVCAQGGEALWPTIAGEVPP